MRTYNTSPRAGPFRAAGSPPAVVSRLAAAIGDSLTEHAFGATPVYWQNGLLGAPLQLIANSGFSGQSIFGLIGQIPNDYKLATAPGLAGLPALGWIVCRIGTNTVRGAENSTGVPLDTSNQGHYRTIRDMLLDKAERVIWMPVPPIGGVQKTKNTAVAGYNAFLQDMCAANSRLHWIDDCADLVDGSGNIIPAYFDSDELHMSGAGGLQMAQTSQTALAALFAGQGYTSPLVTSAADVYPAQPQWTTNPTNVGTGGTFGSGWSGQCPNGWRVETNGAGLSGTVQIKTADVGDPNQVPWVSITPTASSATAAIAITMTAGHRTITSSDPSELEQLLEVRLNSFQQYNDLTTWIQAGGTRFVKKGRLRWSASAGATARATLQQKYYREQPGASGTATNYIYLASPNNFSGSMGSIDLRCWSVRG